MYFGGRMATSRWQIPLRPFVRLNISPLTSGRIKKAATGDCKYFKSHLNKNLTNLDVWFVGPPLNPCLQNTVSKHNCKHNCCCKNVVIEDWQTRTGETRCGSLVVVSDCNYPTVWNKENKQVDWIGVEKQCLYLREWGGRNKDACTLYRAAVSSPPHLLAQMHMHHTLLSHTDFPYLYSLYCTYCTHCTGMQAMKHRAPALQTSALQCR